MLAQAYVLKYPARFSRLVLADTFSSAADVNTSLARMRRGVPEATRAVYDHYEQEGLYKDRDRYPDEYQAALDIAYEPVTLSVPVPNTCRTCSAKWPTMSIASCGARLPSSS